MSWFARQKWTENRLLECKLRPFFCCFYKGTNRIWVGAMMHKIYRTKSRENILLFLEENKERMLSAVEIYG